MTQNDWKVFSCLIGIISGRTDGLGARRSGFRPATGRSHAAGAASASRSRDSRVRPGLYLWQAVVPPYLGPLYPYGNAFACFDECAADRAIGQGRETAD